MKASKKIQVAIFGQQGLITNLLLNVPIAINAYEMGVPKLLFGILIMIGGQYFFLTKELNHILFTLAKLLLSLILIHHIGACIWLMLITMDILFIGFWIRPYLRGIL